MLIALTRRLLHHGGHDRLVPEVARRLITRSDGVTDLARNLGMTTRTLHRRSLDAFGYGPSVLRAILRLQRLLALHKSRPYLKLGELTAAAGYADQSHLARDTARLAARTPRALLTSKSADWHGQGSVVDVRSVQDTPFASA